jgi:hypothetical protein
MVQPRPKSLTGTTESSRVNVVCAPIVPLVVRPMCVTMTSAPALVIRSASLTLKRMASSTDQICVPISSFQPPYNSFLSPPGSVGIEYSINEADCGEVLHSGESRFLTSFNSCDISEKGPFRICQPRPVYLSRGSELHRSFLA